MQEIISRIYELTNSAILTPHNLLENILLDNYHEIKYRTTSDYIICEMLTVEESSQVQYFYEFDFNNKLQQAYALYINERIELFNRTKELTSLLKNFEYQKQTQKKIG